MARSRWKFLFFDKRIWRLIFLKQVILKKKWRKLKPSIWCRGAVIPKCCYRFRFLLHSGKFFLPLKIKKAYIGSKFGEFAFTRKIFYYPMRKKIKPRK